jgi:hypothetical protein
MNSGTPVECINNKGFEKFVKLETPYTVLSFVERGKLLINNPRGVLMTGEEGIFLVETKGPDFFYYEEIVDVPFPLRCFRELMPGLEKQIEEILKDEVLS